MQKKNNTYYNDETDEIIGKIPPWIIRRGNTIILLIFISLIIISCFITYQDSIITSSNVYYYDNHFIATAMIPERDFGKLKIGQKVIINLKSYPEMEYGHLTGTVSKISTVLENDTYPISINIYSTTTNYGNHIMHIAKMTADIEIIVAMHPLILKLIIPLKQFFQNEFI
jgi:hypothetical protein